MRFPRAVSSGSFSRAARPRQGGRLAAERITGLYRRHAALFDGARSRALFERGWLDRFAALLPRGGRVLDVGCGMGEPLARHLAGLSLAITGLDASPELLALARARLPDQAWIEGDMRALDLRRGFDGVMAWDSLFHLDAAAQRATLPRLCAHAMRALMFTSGPRAGVAIGRFGGEALFHASLDPEEYRTLLARAGFRVVAHRAEDPGCGHHTVWLAVRQAAAG